ncbi:hypothetical protein BGW42_001479 [Actinomortierella wolfii]|nr:hypothetical protein BGW42_001479 [Actinomortierella wolfii]
MISLNLFIDLWGAHKTEECLYFDTLLGFAKRLRRIRLRPAHDADPYPGCVSSDLYEAIMRHTAPRLEELRINFTFLQSDTAERFFRSCTQLKALDISASRELARVICASPLSLEELQLCPNAEDEDPLINNDGLAELGQWLSNGKTFVTRHFLFTEVGVRRFLSVCSKNLTRIGFAGCEEISPTGFQQIVEELPLLEHVDFSDTKACDATILKLAQVSRAPRLKVLIISDCRRITSLSVRQIVTCCENLTTLDCEGCPYIQMNIFDPPAWVSCKLQQIMIGGIHHDLARDGQERPPPVTDDHLSNMYYQLGHMRRLQILSLRGRLFPPKMFELGRTALERLPHLMAIDISTEWDLGLEPPMRRDYIWMATCLPQLTYLTINQASMDDDLRDDLVAINSRLRIERVADDGHSVLDDDSDVGGRGWPGSWSDDHPFSYYDDDDNDENNDNDDNSDTSNDSDDHSSHDDPGYEFGHSIFWGHSSPDSDVHDDSDGSHPLHSSDEEQHPYLSSDEEEHAPHTSSDEEEQASYKSSDEEEHGPYKSSDESSDEAEGPSYFSSGDEENQMHLSSNDEGQAQDSVSDVASSESDRGGYSDSSTNDDLDEDTAVPYSDDEQNYSSDEHDDYDQYDEGSDDGYDYDDDCYD